MRRIGMAVWVSLVIALAGLPQVCRRRGGDDGLVAEWHFEEGSGSVLGKIKVSSGQYFTTPVEAVMECLEERGEEPDRCSPSKIADGVGVPLAVVLEMIGGCWGDGRYNNWQVGLV
ncbi:MAG: hypothetical protein C4B59_10485 [Candidatus Methanogaster sp.]|uniref:Uncharacterized protein n=1 Tax=Candidatus Methanogaster sp. TaxID=3386292 RepID=A0AC61L1F3_9EURY|nr:MAG: hypothetical protein C4B59_10485 [ANME-2 cluster archaeon]